MLAGSWTIHWAWAGGMAAGTRGVRTAAASSAAKMGRRIMGRGPPAGGVVVRAGARRPSPGRHLRPVSPCHRRRLRGARRGAGERPSHPGRKAFGTPHRGAPSRALFDPVGRLRGRAPPRADAGDEQVAGMAAGRSEAARERRAGGALPRVRLSGFERFAPAAQRRFVRSPADRYSSPCDRLLPTEAPRFGHNRRIGTRGRMRAAAPRRPSPQPLGAPRQRHGEVTSSPGSDVQSGLVGSGYTPRES